MSKRIGTVFFLLLIATVYSNTLHSDWQLDDKPNIVDNAVLHIDNLMPGTLWRTLFAKPGHQELYRPLPCLSFALNWYFGENDPFGYHLVNIGIHILNSGLLFFVILSLFQTPRLKPAYSAIDARYIAFLSVALWTVNPMQTQAVTYIVQRMTSMATLFYLFGIYLYIKARFEAVSWKQVLFFTGCGLSFLCALGSKENAVMMPAALILVELAFFQPGNSRLAKMIRRTLVVCTIAVLGFLIIWTTTGKELEVPLAGGYQSRPFSLSQRLLTEPRIVLYYLSQLVYPIPSRLSIEHDVIVSTSLFDPWTTLPSILTLFGLIGLGFALIRKQPLAAFGLLFFFLNHVVESSFIPLELVFEHRNYLPSCFLFVPVAGALYRMYRYFEPRRKVIARGFAGLALVLVAFWSYGTFVRNLAWRDKVTLWQDALRKAPGSARPLGVLAIELAWGENISEGRYRLAVKMFEKSLTLKKARNFLDADILGNIASIYFNQGLYEKASHIYQKVVQIDPFFLKARYDFIKTLFLLQRWDEALQQADKLLTNRKQYTIADYFNIKGYILLWQDKPAAALPYFRKALRMEPMRPDILLNTGVTLSRMGLFQQARWFLQQALKKTNDRIGVYFFLIENCLKADNIDNAKAYVEKMETIATPMSIAEKLETARNNLKLAPVDIDLVSPFVRGLLAEGKDLGNLLLSQCIH